MQLLLQSGLHAGGIILRLIMLQNYYHVTALAKLGWVRNEEEKGKKQKKPPRTTTFMNCRNYLRDDWKEETQKKSTKYKAFLSQKKLTLKPAEIHPP